MTRTVHEPGIVAPSILAGGPLVPIVQIDELGIGSQSVVPPLLEIYAVASWVIHCLAQPRHIGTARHIVLVKLWLQSVARPGFPYSHVTFVHSQRMLGWRDSSLFQLPLVLGDQLLGSHTDDVQMVHLVTETPVVFSTDISFALRFIIAPPHIAQGKIVKYLLWIVTGAHILVLPVSVARRVGVIEQQRLAIPVEPEVLVFSCLIVSLIELLDYVHRLVVVGPEHELRSTVALLSHLHHGGEEHFPLVPVADAVGDIHHQDIHARILKHGNIVADNPFVLTQEVTYFRFAPMVGTVFPKRMAALFSGHRVFVQNLRHIGIRSLQVVIVGRMPSDVKDAHHPTVVGLDVAHQIIHRHLATQCVRSYPSVAHQVSFNILLAIHFCLG